MTDNALVTVFQQRNHNQIIEGLHLLSLQPRATSVEAPPLSRAAALVSATMVPKQNRLRNFIVAGSNETRRGGKENDILPERMGKRYPSAFKHFPRGAGTGQVAFLDPTEGTQNPVFGVLGGLFLHGIRHFACRETKES